MRRLPVPAGVLSGIVTCNNFSTSARRTSDKDGQEAADHHEESFEEFTARYQPLCSLWNGQLAGKPILEKASFMEAASGPYQS